MTILTYKSFHTHTHLVSRLRSYPPHPGYEERSSPPVLRSSSPFHQNSSTRHHLDLYARRELFMSIQIEISFYSFFWGKKSSFFKLSLEYLLFIDFKCLLNIGDLWRANWQSLDFTGSKSTEVTDCFDVSGSHKLPKTTRPMKRINSIY